MFNRKTPRAKGKERVNAIPTAYNNVQYKSKTEVFCAQELDKSELPWSYESSDCKLILVPPFEFQGKKVLQMAYTCDFSIISPKGRRFLLETKGYRQDTWVLKEKWIKYHIHSNNLNIIFLVVSTKQEIMEAIELIKRS